MKINSLQELSILQNNSVEYKGELPEYQQTGSKQLNKKYIDYLKEEFNQIQNELYKRALFGLNYFDQKEIKRMHKGKRQRIIKVHRRAQQSINLFKQERVNALCNSIFEAHFPENKERGVKASNTVQNVALLFSTKDIGTDPKFINTLELRTLGITKAHIVERFVKEGILPKNFYELKEAV